MEHNVHNDMTRTSMTLDLATIEEDTDEIDDHDYHTTGNNLNKLTNKNGKRLLSQCLYEIYFNILYNIIRFLSI